MPIPGTPFIVVLRDILKCVTHDISLPISHSRLTYSLLTDTTTRSTIRSLDSPTPIAIAVRRNEGGWLRSCV